MKIKVLHHRKCNIVEKQQCRYVDVCYMWVIETYQ